MGKPYVLVDTNIVRNEQSLDYLLGARKALTELKDAITLVVPDMVIEELIVQKRAAFEDAKQRLSGNFLIDHLLVSTSDIESLDFLNFESSLREDSSIPYIIAQMPSDEGSLDTIKEMALHNSPPFNKENDKGFKDACVVLAMAHFISGHSAESVYVISNDGRVRDYFDADKRCVCLKSLDDLKIRIYWNGEQQSCKVNEREVSKTDQQSYDAHYEVQALLDDLRNSGSFSHTHLIIGKLTAKRQSLSIQDKVELFDIAASNDQVSWIMKDPDMIDFYLPLFRECEPLLDERAYSTFVRVAEIADIRAKRRESPEFSDYEIKTYREFADQLVDSFVGISEVATINTNFDFLLPNLEEIQKTTILEETLNPLFVAESVIEGPFECYAHKRLDSRVFSSFVDMLANATPEKGEVMCQSLYNRLREVPKLQDDILF